MNPILPIVNGDDEMKNMSQREMILQHLKEGKEITPKEAYFEYDSLRLGAIIFDLRQEGYKISTRLVFYKNKRGNTSHYAVYKLIDKEIKQ